MSKVDNLRPFLEKYGHSLTSDQIKEERDKKSFCYFLATFEQLFEKFRATCWEISSNVWQALGNTDKISLTSRRALRANLCSGFRVISQLAMTL